jgi:plasmid replication initiation protein
MSDELLSEPANTPETLGVTPRYILQHNAVSRGAHGLSATAKKLTAMAMSLLPPDLSSLTAAFTFPEFCKALGMPIGGESYEIFKKAVDECMESVITVETEPDEKGKKEWKKYTWFTVSTFSEKTGQATMKFSSELAGFLVALKWMYSKIDLKDLGDLQSRYAIRLFEIAMSYMSLKGKGGNNGSGWYFERPLPELRQIMGVPDGAYKETHLFKQKVIDAPIKEINKAGIGLEITPETIKQGRQIVGIRFDCKQSRKTAKGRGKKKAAEPLPEPNPKTEYLREEQELEHLKELYQAEFTELYEAELAKTPSFIPDGFKRMAAEGSAVMQLKARHGIVK